MRFARRCRQGHVRQEREDEVRKELDRCVRASPRMPIGARGRSAAPAFFSRRTVRDTAFRCQPIATRRASVQSAGSIARLHGSSTRSVANRGGRDVEEAERLRRRQLRGVAALLRRYEEVRRFGPGRRCSARGRSENACGGRGDAPGGGGALLRAKGKKRAPPVKEPDAPAPPIDEPETDRDAPQEKARCHVRDAVPDRR